MHHKTLLVALPFAGSNSYCYDFLRKLLPRNIILETLEYSGRGQRSEEPLLNEMSTVIADLHLQYRSLISKVRPSRVALYGHSMGAVIGLQFLHFVKKEASVFKTDIAIFSGQGAPVTTERKRLNAFGDKQLIDYFVNIGSLSPVIAAEVDFMNYLLPILRNDLYLYENYIAYNGALNIPLAMINGKQDSILPKDIEGWALETKGGTKFYDMDGGHFFFNQQPEVFAGLITGIINNGS